MRVPSGVYDAVATEVERGRTVALLTVIESPDETELGAQLVWCEGRAVAERGLGDEARARLNAWSGAHVEQLLREDTAPSIVSLQEPSGWRLYVEVFGCRPRLLIAGAGHIAQPLAEIGALLDFEVWVYDDRLFYATQERFARAARVIAAPFEELSARVSIDWRTWVVIVTRGHLHDAQVLRRVLDTQAPYIGMIGSRRRVRTVVDDLLRQGVSEESLARIYAPIGIDIHAETPEEIAISIAAEIVNVRRGGRAPSLRLADRLVGAAHRRRENV